jgi:hypothetical protein
MRYLNTLLDQFWKRWTAEYLVVLREIHNHMTQRRNSSIQIAVGDIVIVHNEKKPRGFWSLGRVEQVLPGRDDEIRSAEYLLGEDVQISFDDLYSGCTL